MCFLTHTRSSWIHAMLAQRVLTSDGTNAPNTELFVGRTIESEWKDWSSFMRRFYVPQRPPLCQEALIKSICLLFKWNLSCFNTDFLHENLSFFKERFISTLPKTLKVVIFCFFNYEYLCIFPTLCEDFKICIWVNKPRCKCTFKFTEVWSCDLVL